VFQKASGPSLRSHRAMIRSIFLCLLLPLCLSAADKPNMIFILCDDLGYGDVKCLNPGGKIATPHLDGMAARGMIFSDAHSSSSVCSPTRYGVMTGRYNWRTKLQQSVLGGLSPRLIEPGRMTVASMLKENGYATACVGKWHLGMDWVKLPGKEVSELSIETEDQVNNVDYTQPTTNGPTSVGFDSYFGISASLDMVPYVFIRNDRVTVNPTEKMKLEMNATTRNGKSYTREGPAAPGFRGEDVLPEFTREATKVIGEKAKSGQPFFLYLPLNSPHTPILPSEKWRGKSGISLYADFVMETDDAIGQVIDSLKQNGVLDNTLVIVTSDNGCSPSADYKTLAEHGHNPSFHFRGTKADVFDGGHRVPYIVQWPAVVKGGGKYDHPIGLWDFMATAADITGAKVPDNAAEDSISFLPALRGGLDKPVRDHLVSHSINGSFVIREGNWKLCLCPDSGGWSDPRPGNPKGKGKQKVIPQAGLEPIQLYDLSTDISEKTNVQSKHPEIVAKLVAKLEKLIADGRTTPGAPQKNTVEPNPWRYAKRPL
jgi:arylsulfatase A